MSLFSVSIEVANPQDEQFAQVEAVVDTGATYSVLPASFLEGLGLSPSEELDVTLADASIKTWGLAEARFRIDGRERTSPVVFGDEGIFLLGAMTLEIFGRIADTTNQRLVPPPEVLAVGVRVPGLEA